MNYDSDFPPLDGMTGKPIPKDSQVLYVEKLEAGLSNNDKKSTDENREYAKLVTACKMIYMLLNSDIITNEIAIDFLKKFKDDKVLTDEALKMVNSNNIKQVVSGVCLSGMQFGI